MTNPTKLAEALVSLNFRIARGEEFPDACFAVASRYNIAYEALADAYDEFAK
jgi:hypothetical protein